MRNKRILFALFFEDDKLRKTSEENEGLGKKSSNRRDIVGEAAARTLDTFWIFECWPQVVSALRSIETNIRSVCDAVRRIKKCAKSTACELQSILLSFYSHLL